MFTLTELLTCSAQTFVYHCIGLLSTQPLSPHLKRLLQTSTDVHLKHSYRTAFLIEQKKKEIKETQFTISFHGTEIVVCLVVRGLACTFETTGLTDSGTSISIRGKVLFSL